MMANMGFIGSIFGFIWSVAMWLFWAFTKIVMFFVGMLFGWTLVVLGIIVLGLIALGLWHLSTKKSPSE
jgi:hypothetical protein